MLRSLLRTPVGGEITANLARWTEPRNCTTARLLQSVQTCLEIGVSEPVLRYARTGEIRRNILITVAGASLAAV